MDTRSAWIDSHWVPGLIEHDVNVARQPHHHGDAIAFVFRLAGDLNTLGTQFADCGVNVIAHERDLMPPPDS